MIAWLRRRGRRARRFDDLGRARLGEHLPPIGLGQRAPTEPGIRAEAKVERKPGGGWVSR